ncbi:MAG: hypothetical protein GQ569_04730 [Methylococcaceae bacterium]|nr:hypothetical protein [Methylococcaceae bacterium]
MYVADARLDKEGEVATLTIVKSGREVLIGDRLMENAKGEFTLNFIPEPPAEEITANIISVLDGVSQIGKYNVVVIDKGEKNDIKIGHVFDIYQKGRMITDKVREGEGEEKSQIRLPDEVAGTLMVFRTFKRVSYALVMDAKRAIHLLDKVKTAK